MNKVITINLNGNAYQLEEAGYEALRDYLDHAARQLDGNPDKGEIMADIEQAIADKCRAVLGMHRTVVSTPDIKTIIAEMGPVDDGSVGGAGEKTGDSAGAAGPKPAGDAGATGGPLPKRLYRVTEGKMIGGVCNGIAAYLNIDVTIVRLLFVLLAFLGGTTVLVYLVLMIVVPVADTAAAKAAAFGIPATAQEFIRRAKEGYYEGMKTWGDKQAHREWKRKFKQEMRSWKRDFHQQMSENARQWRENWRNTWNRPPHPPASYFVVLPFVALLCTLITLLWLVAFVSFLFTGAIFGLVLPGVPWWGVLILLFVAYQLAVWPLRAIKHSCRYGAPGWYPYSVFHGLWDGIMGLVVLAFLVWLVDRFVPGAHEMLLNLPHTLRHAADSLQQWWSQK
ncbi:MAG TPA: PspC domain-containing protein [Opitutaceae bacterium]|nr:PspC domain-containing protein [Opitutaceae bacterium]